MTTSTLPARRTPSGKRIPAGTPRPLTWHELVRPSAPPTIVTALEDTGYGNDEPDAATIADADDALATETPKERKNRKAREKRAADKAAKLAQQ